MNDQANNIRIIRESQIRMEGDIKGVKSHLKRQNGSIEEQEVRIRTLEDTHLKGGLNIKYIAIAVIFGAILVAAGLNLTEFIGKIL